MWQLCHFESNSEWVILNLKGNNVNIVKSRKNGETRISQYLVIHVIKRKQVKNFCVSSPGWCVACFDLKTLDNIPTDDTFECYEKNIQVEKLISYHIAFATWITGYYENTRQSFLCRFPGGCACLFWCRPAWKLWTKAEPQMFAYFWWYW